MLTIACCFWDINANTFQHSKCYDESWVDKLYRGFARNLTKPFHFVCFTERPRTFCDGVEQRLLRTDPPDCGCLIEPFQIEGPLIVVGLDTVIVGNIDHLAEYCERADRVALPRDPYVPGRSINAVALVPPNHTHVFADWRGENDMAWLRTYPWNPIDDLWPGHVVSLKFHDVRRQGLQKARVVYFHGKPKMHDLTKLDWIKEHWR